MWFAFLGFLGRFSGFLFFLTLINSDSIRLLEMLLFFLWCYTFGGRIYVNRYKTREVGLISMLFKKADQIR